MSCGHFVFHVVDAILIPTPFYGVITEDLHLYSDVKLFHVPLGCEVGTQGLIYLQLLLCACDQNVCSVCTYCALLIHILIHDIHSI